MGHAHTHHRLRRGTTILARGLMLCGVAAIAGCGSSGSSGGSSAGAGSTASSTSSGAIPNACKVLTSSIAKSTVGSTATLTRKAQPNPHETQCVYTSSTGAVSLMVGNWEFIHEFGGAATGSQATPVHGIGDEATLTSTDLTVRKGSRGMTITVITQAGTFNGAAERQSARDAAAEKKVALKLLPRL